METNALYYGDNLVWLKNHDCFPNESVDLIYLDPPFNSNADYNVIFKEESGEQSQAQLLAFDDTWRWDKEASASALGELSNSCPDIAQLITIIGSRRDKISTSMAAYLGMMATRLLELHRVLKSTGSIFLHCDHTASHYLKIILDTIFGAGNFRNEIIWKRTSAHSDSGVFGNAHDVIFYYSKSNKFTRLKQYQPYRKDYIDSHYRHKDKNGRLYRWDNLTAIGLSGGGYKYEWHGVTNIWRCPIERMKELDAQGKIRYTKSGTAEFIRYLDEMPGMPAQDIWDDIAPINSQAKERLGYPTQKPIELLERIILATSNEGDVVLDPFCGCGTAIIAANKLKRKWIGIDITHVAMYLIEQRLKDSFGESIKKTYQVYGNPCDVASAQALWNTNKKEFEIWALSLVGAKPRPYDGGVDGILGFMETGNKPQKIVVQVKGGTSLVPSMIRDLIGTVEKEEAAIGLLISLHKPSLGMITDSVHAGNYKSELWNKEFLKIQIRTVFDLLEGKTFDIPQTYSLLKKAARVKESGETTPLL